MDTVENTVICHYVSVKMTVFGQYCLLKLSESFWGVLRSGALFHEGNQSDQQETGLKVLVTSLLSAGSGCFGTSLTVQQYLKVLHSDQAPTVPAKKRLFTHILQACWACISGTCTCLEMAQAAHLR